MFPPTSSRVPDQRPRIAMEYSPLGAVPYVSKLDAGREGADRGGYGRRNCQQRRLGAVDPGDTHRRADGGPSATPRPTVWRSKIWPLRILPSSCAPTHPSPSLMFSNLSTTSLPPTGSTPIIRPLSRSTPTPPIPTMRQRAQQSAIIQPGDMVLIDLWAREAGDPAPVLPTSRGRPTVAQDPPAAMPSFEIVRQGRGSGDSHYRQRFAAGEPVYGYEVDDACRDVIADAGLGDHFSTARVTAWAAKSTSPASTSTTWRPKIDGNLCRASCSPSSRASISRTSTSMTRRPKRQRAGHPQRNQLLRPSRRPRRGNDAAACRREIAALLSRRQRSL